MSEFRASAIILAGGVGSRMESDKSKQFIKIFGKTVLERTVSAFDQSEKINEIIVVARCEEMDDVRSLLGKIEHLKPLKIVCGGACRAESAKNGFLSVDDKCDYVAIHDGARCLISTQMINKVVEKAYIYGAATAVCGISDTVKSVDCDGKIVSTIPREYLSRAQTPQVFSKKIYKRALDECKDLSRITDDNMLVEGLGVEIYTVDIGQTNIKITTKEDIIFAKNILIGRGEGEVCGFRIGHGYDVHKLINGRKMIIGGVEIPYDKGLLGHSDADVLLHAIMDSILGAAALGDIGRHFPDTSDEYKGASSLHLLAKVAEMIKGEGYAVVNIDATLILQKPKIASYVPKMISNIAFALGVSQNCINVKATTEETLGFTGREEGASAHAVTILTRIDDR